MLSLVLGCLSSDLSASSEFWNRLYRRCVVGGAGLHTEVGQMVREKWRSLLASCCQGTSYVPDKRLGQLLEQWGGDEDEGVGLAEKEGGDRERRLKVLGEDLTAEELKEVLQVSLQDNCVHPRRL